MNFLKKLDKGIAGITGAYCAVSQIIITVIVIVQVISRNVFYFDLGLATNIPVYMLISGVWVGAVAIARKKEHITVPIINVVIKNQRIIDVITLVLDILVAGALSVFSYKGFYYCLHTLFERGTIDPSLGISEWKLKIVIPICAMLMAIYYVKFVIDDIRRFKSQ